MLASPSFPKWVEVVDCPFMGAPLSLYLIRSEKLTLIDSGINETPERFLFPYLQQQGLAPADLSIVINTHGHHDHFGGNGAIYRANPAVIFAVHRRDLEWVEDSIRHLNEMYLSFPDAWEPDSHYKNEVLKLCGESVPVSLVLENDDLIRLGKDIVLRCLSVPSHSKGHIALYLESERICFVGDAIQGKGTRLSSGVIVFPLYEEVETYLSTLKKIQSLPSDWFCTGHFGILDRRQAEHLIELSARQVDIHSGYVADILRDSPLPLSLKQIVLQLHKAHYADYECAFQIHATTHAHLRHLQKLKKAERVLVSGKLLWKVSL